MQRKTFTPVLFAFFFLATLPAAWSHQGLNGLVRSADEQEPLVGATIQIKDLGLAVTTDLNGAFLLEEVPEGKFVLQVEYLGYATQEMVVEIPRTNETPLDIQLESASIDLPSVDVRSSDPSRNVLSQLDAQLRPLQSSQEYLQLVPGLFIAQHAGGGKAEQLFLRGFDLDHGTDIAIRVDGMPVNMISHAHGQGYADLHFLLPEIVEQISYQKGPYQTEVGNLATAGVIDFRTKDHLHQALAKVEIGQFGRVRATALAPILDRPNTNWYVGGSREFMEGYFESPQNLERLHLTQQFTQRFANRQKITLSTNHFSSTWLASGQIPQRAVDAGLISRFGAIDDTEGGQTTRSDLRFALYAPLSGGGIIEQTVYASRYTFELFSNFTFFANDPINGDQIRQKEERWMSGFDGSYAKPHRLFNQNGFTRIGWQTRFDQTQDSELSRSLNRTETLERLAYGDIQEWNGALYVEESLSPHPDWNIDLGVRYDLFYFSYLDRLPSIPTTAQTTAGIWSPKLEIQYTPKPFIALLGKVGRGFHSNDARLMVQPEEQATLAAAWGADFSLRLKPSPKVLVELTAWGLNLEEELVYVGDEAIIERSGPSERRGFDLSLRWEILPQLTADSDLTLSRARLTDLPEGENFIPLAPRQTATGGLTWQPAETWEGSLRFRYLSDRPATEDGQLSATGYFLSDLGIAWQPKKWRLAVSVINLFNQEWDEAQFATTSRLFDEAEPVEEMHFTPGAPFFLNTSFSIRF